jgi:hypothetical protein
MILHLKLTQHIAKILILKELSQPTFVSSRTLLWTCVCEDINTGRVDSKVR